MAARARVGPGVIGFSCLTQQYAAGLELAEWLRKRAREERVELPQLVVGGIHPTMVPLDVMKDGAWDHVGVGECEDALLELVTRLERGERPDDVRNFVSWRQGRRPANAARSSHVVEHWVHNPVGEFPDFANLPEPDYELFDTQRITDQKQGWFGLMSSRGCPYRCTYCLNHKIVDRYKEELGRNVKNIGFFRFRSADKMIAEIRNVLARYKNIGTFILDDDLFTQNVPHALAFCEKYIEAGIGVPWVVNSHVKQLDERVAEALARAGCRILKLGIESGSLRVRRDVLKRHMTQKDILETVAGAEKHRLHSSGFLMIGLPTETHAERWETVDILAQSRIGRFRTRPVLCAPVALGASGRGPDAFVTSCFRVRRGGPSRAIASRSRSGHRRHRSMSHPQEPPSRRDPSMLHHKIALFSGCGAAALGLVLLACGAASQSKAARFANAQDVKTGEAAGKAGDLAVAGRVECSAPLRSPIAGVACLFYSYQVEARWEETYYDEASKTTKKRSRSKEITHTTQGAVITIDDGSGPVAVALDENADMDLVSHTESRPGGVDFPVGTTLIATERVLEVAPTFTAIGTMKGDQLDSHGLVLSTLSRTELVTQTAGTAKTLNTLGTFLVLLGGLGAIAGLVLRRRSRQTQESMPAIALA